MESITGARMCAMKTFTVSVLIALLPAFQFGYGIGVMNPLSDEIVRHFNVSPSSAVGYPLAVAIMCPSAIVGTLIASQVLSLTAVPPKGPLSTAITLLRGRRACFIALAPVYMCAGLLFASTTCMQFSGSGASHSGAFVAFVAARVLVGIGAGISSVLVPMYLHEISDEAMRGFTGSLFQLSIVTGILGSNVIAHSSLHSVPDAAQSGVNAWCVCFGVVSMVGALQFILSPLFIVESPMLLIRTSKHNEALSALRRLMSRGASASVGAHIRNSNEAVSATSGDEYACKRRFEALMRECGEAEDAESMFSSAEGENDGEGSEARKDTGVDTLGRGEGNGDGNDGDNRELDMRANLSSVLTAFLLMALQQFSGINGVMYYSRDIFKLAITDQGVLGTFVLGVCVVNFTATIFTVGLIQRFGHRVMLLVSTAGMLFASILLTLGLRLVQSTEGASTSYVPYVCVLSVYAYVFFFALGMGPLPWILVNDFVPEVCEFHAGKKLSRLIGRVLRPTQVTTQGAVFSTSKESVLSLATSANWFSNFFVGLTFPSMKLLLGSACFAPFALVQLMALLWAWQILPESKGRTQRDLSRIIHKRIARCFVFERNRRGERGGPPP